MSRRILVIRQDKLGDLLLTTPLLRALHEQGDHVTLFYQPTLERVVESLTSIDDEGFVPYRPSLFKAFSLARRMRKGRYDAVLILRNDSSSFAIAAWLAGIPIRVGMARKVARHCLTHNRPDLYDLGEDHVIRRMLKIASPLLSIPEAEYPLEFPISDEAKRAGRETIPVGSIVVHPGTGGSARPYSVSSWKEIVAALAGRGKVFVTAGPGEEAVAREVAGEVATVVTGLDLEELAGALSGAKVLVCGSTGVLHVAASQQTPTILVEPSPDALKNVARWHPWLCSHRTVAATAICPGCADRRCLKKGTDCVDSIPPSRVIAVAYDFLDKMSE